jgi:hypothetical protein
MDKEYKYDIALSFLYDDEPLAQQIYDELKSKFEVFIYTEKQKLLVGSDGMDTFSDVFSSQSRLNVVLYRTGWGKTKWTRVEETAIRGRIFEEGWESLALVNLDNSMPPKWIHKTFIYIDYSSLKFDIIIGIIEHKAKEVGSKVKIESIEDIHARIEQELETKEFIRLYLESSKAAEDAFTEISNLFATVENQVDQLKEKQDRLKFSFVKKEFNNRDAKNLILVRSGNIELQFYWICPNLNNLEDSHLTIFLIDNIERYSNTPYKNLSTNKYLFDMNERKELVWTHVRKRESFSSKDIVDLSFKHLFNAIKKVREFEGFGPR